jgi:hypothetical protein
VVEQAKVLQVRVAVSHHDGKRHLFKKSVQVIAVQLELAQQFSDALVAAVVLSV